MNPSSRLGRVSHQFMAHCLLLLAGIYIAWGLWFLATCFHLSEIIELENNEKLKDAIAFMLNWEIFENKKIVLLYQLVSAVLMGVCGTIIVSMFLAAILPISTVVNFVPWLIGFNTAMTGYSLVEKTRTSLKYRHVTTIGAGISNVLITAALLIGLSVYTIGINLFSLLDLAIFMIIGAACSELGAWLAFKYHKL